MALGRLPANSVCSGKSQNQDGNGGEDARMLELYENQVSTSAQKVRLVLAEKAVDYTSHMMNLQAGDQFDPKFLALNPDAVVPCLVHDGEVYTESSVICEYLDDAFPEPPLKPASAHDRARMRSWTVQTDSWLLTMINNINVGIVFRVTHASKTPDELEEFLASYPEPIKRERQRELISKGAGSPLVGHAVRRCHKLMGDLDTALAKDGPWLAGASLSLADTGIFPYVNRLHDLEFEPLWTGRPAYLEWYGRMKARPSFKKAIGDVVPAQTIEFSRKCVADVAPRIEEIMDAL